MISTIVTITRPNDSDVFFYDSQWFIDHSDQFIEFYNIAVLENKVLDLIKNTSNLSSTRIIIFSSLTAKNEFTQQLGSIVAGSYDNFLKIRKDYCDSVGHTLEIIENN